MSFAEGFFGTLANNIQDKREFIRSRVEEDRRYLREQGLRRQAQVAEQRNMYQTAAEQLLRIDGVDRNRVLAALEADPDGVRDIASRDITDSTVINEVFQLAEGHTASSGSLSDILDTVMPAVSALPSDADPTTKRRTTIASWLGLDTETELNDQVYNSQIVGGMTGDQILASMSVPVRARGTNQGVSFNYNALAPQERMSRAEVNTVISSNVLEYETLRDQRLQQIADELNNPSESTNLSALMEEQQRLEAISGTNSDRLGAFISEFGPTENFMAYYNDPRYSSIYTLGLLPPSALERIQRSSEPEDQTEQSGLAPVEESQVLSEEPFDISVEVIEEAQEPIENFFKNNPEATVVKVKIPSGSVVEIQRQGPDFTPRRRRGGPAPVQEVEDKEVRPQARPENLQDKNQAVELAQALGDTQIASSIQDLGLSGNQRVLRRNVDRIIRTLRQRNQTEEILNLIEVLSKLKG